MGNGWRMGEGGGEEGWRGGGECVEEDKWDGMISRERIDRVELSNVGRDQ